MTKSLWSERSEIELDDRWQEHLERELEMRFHGVGSLGASTVAHRFLTDSESGALLLRVRLDGDRRFSVELVAVAEAAPLAAAHRELRNEVRAALERGPAQQPSAAVDRDPARETSTAVGGEPAQRTSRVRTVAGAVLLVTRVLGWLAVDLLLIAGAFFWFRFIDSAVTVGEHVWWETALRTYFKVTLEATPIVLLALQTLLDAAGAVTTVFSPSVARARARRHVASYRYLRFQSPSDQGYCFPTEIGLEGAAEELVGRLLKLVAATIIIVALPLIVLVAVAFVIVAALSQTSSDDQDNRQPQPADRSRPAIYASAGQQRGNRWSHAGVDVIPEWRDGKLVRVRLRSAARSTESGS